MGGNDLMAEVRKLLARHPDYEASEGAANGDIVIRRRARDEPPESERGKAMAQAIRLMLRDDPAGRRGRGWT